MQQSQFLYGIPEENKIVVKMKGLQLQSFQLGPFTASWLCQCKGRVEYYKMPSDFSRYTVLQGKGFLGLTGWIEYLALWKMSQTLPRAKGHKTFISFVFVESEPRGAKRTMLFLRGLESQPITQSYFCKARELHPSLWKGFPQNKPPKNWLAPIKLYSSSFSDQTEELKTSLATDFSGRSDGKQR